MKHPLSNPLSIAQLSPMTGIYSNSAYLDDKQGFTDTIMNKWWSRQNAHAGIITSQHHHIADQLYDFYVELRTHIDALSPAESPKRALLNVSVHELMRGGTVDEAQHLLRQHAQFIARSDQIHQQSDPLDPTDARNAKASLTL